MIDRRTLIGGLVGAAVTVAVTGPEAQAQVFGTFDVPDQLLPLYLSNQSWVGLPISDVMAVTGGLKQRFTSADLYHSSSVGASLVTGKIKSAYDGAGGPGSLGLPIGTEVVSGTYSCRTQGFVSGRIWYSSTHGSRVAPSSKTVRLSGAPNFRDVAGEGSGISVSGGRMRRGMVYRSSRLGSINSRDKFILQTLGVGTTVALSSSTPPTIPGITKVRYSIYNPSSSTLAQKQAMYRQYVTSSSNRSSVGKVLKLIASNNKPVVFQCLRGWDRTGWVAAVIQGLLGASSSTIMNEFLKSNSYNGPGVKSAYLDAAVSTMKSRYGSYHGYVSACGVSDSAVSTLRDKLIR